MTGGGQSAVQRHRLLRSKKGEESLEKEGEDLSKINYHLCNFSHVWEKVKDSGPEQGFRVKQI